MPYVKSKNKDNPQTLGDVTSNCNELAGVFTNRDDKVWYFSRYEHIIHDHNTLEQKLPSWKGFHHLVSPQNHNDSFAIRYLPFINDSPTKYEVFQEILLQCKAKSEALNLNVVDLVFDYAVYSIFKGLGDFDEKRKQKSEGLHKFENGRIP